MCVCVSKVVKSIHTCQGILAMLLAALPDMSFNGLKNRVQISLKRKGDDSSISMLHE